MTHLIAGYGEVGRGLGEVIQRTNQTVAFHDPYLDLHQEGSYDILHICFPYSAVFVDSVHSLQKLFQPRLTIIHATVQVGTTREVGKATVYSFVRGRHPNLGQEMTLHAKHIGGLRKQDIAHAYDVLSELGFSCKVQSSPEAVELGKLWDTTYYGICIAATKLAKEMADHYQIPWKDIAAMNMSYNATALTKFRRPELDPIDGPIGGHCVVPNTRILAKTFAHPLLSGVLRYEEKDNAVE